MSYIIREVEQSIRDALRRHKSVLLLGPRQTGKTTLLERLKADGMISFIRPDIRQRYEKNPSLLIGEVEALQEKKGSRVLMLLDEVQKVPNLLDAVQDLIDRQLADFVITGSSARKLRRAETVNLLPGRLVTLRLDPLTLREYPQRSLTDLLLYGSLPGIIQVKELKDREQDLESYAVAYLEEEIRAEAIVRNVGTFARFLEYAGLESGKQINFRNLSQEIGVAHTTIASYFEILEDCLIIERIEPITESKTRKKLAKTQKYLFFDLGVRRICAKESPSLHPELVGHLFEQLMGLELIHQARFYSSKIQIKYWRDHNGPEVDWVVENSGEYIPVEVKWTKTPSSYDVKNLEIFLKEYPNTSRGYLVCQTPKRIKLGDQIIGLPWAEIEEVLSKHAQ